jgi:multicomponent Na+:H+ antiporter subunit G
MTWLGAIFVLAGSVLLVVAAYGLFVLPDALSRQHASTKAATVALTSTLIGVGLLGGTPAWWWRTGAIVVLLFLTLPMASHMLAMAATSELPAPPDDPAPPDGRPGP